MFDKSSHQNGPQALGDSHINFTNSNMLYIALDILPWWSVVKWQNVEFFDGLAHLNTLFLTLCLLLPLVFNLPFTTRETAVIRVNSFDIMSCFVTIWPLTASNLTNLISDQGLLWPRFFKIRLSLYSKKFQKCVINYLGLSYEQTVTSQLYLLANHHRDHSSLLQSLLYSW